MKIYIDTCVWIDYYQQTKKRYRDFGSEARQVFSLCKNELKLIVSDWIITEFCKKRPRKEIDWLLEKTPHTLVNVTQKDKEEAKKLSPNNYADALHIILAIKHGAHIITTRNMQDFGEFAELLRSHNIDLLPPGSV